MPRYPRTSLPEKEAAMRQLQATRQAQPPHQPPPRRHPRDEYCGKCRACQSLDQFLKGGARMPWPELDVHDVPSTWPAFAEAMKKFGPFGFTTRHASSQR